jgi:TonB family protein
LVWLALPIMGQTNSTAKLNSNNFQPPATPATDTDRIRDGLTGPVRRTRTEVVKVTTTNGKSVEGKPLLLETSEYDQTGHKTQNQYFPIPDATLTGRETYKYDDKGNIAEMTRVGDNGLPANKEVYKYEFDSFGNWTKMTTFVETVDNRRISPAPIEMTYRTIFYYLDDKTVKTTPTNTVAKSSGPALPPAEGMNQLKVSGVAADAHAPGSDSSTQAKVVMDAAPPAAPKPMLKPVSKGVLNGNAVYLPSPTYPDLARNMRTTGLVTVEIVIDENGKVVSAKAVSGPPALKDAAVQAAYRARFSPTKLSDQPVKVAGTINYNFVLPQ